MMEDIKILEFDTQLFGYKIGSIEILNSNKDYINDIILLSKENNIKLLYIKASDENSESIIRSVGGILVDEKRYYVKENLTKNFVSGEVVSYPYDFYTERFLQLVLQSAEFSRFKIDKNFKNNEYEKLYKVWLDRSIKKEIATDILVYYLENKETGFAIFQVKEYTCHFTLLAVDKNYRKLHIGRNLYYSLENKCIEKGIREIELYTQGFNTAACKFHESNGFVLKKVDKIYHLWMQ